MDLSRRDLMKVGLFGSAALMLPLERVARTELAVGNRLAQSQLPQPFTVPFATPPVLQPAFEDAGIAYYDIEQRQVKVEILPGLQTTVWGYNGITPGPTVVAKQGQKIVMRQTNSLPSIHPQLRYNVWTSTHLHGSASLPQYDGYASDITGPGQYKDYQYPNFQDGRTLWYHDHGVHITAENAYMGLAGMYVMHDPHELSLPIPHGRYDVPLVIRDAMFQQNGDLIIDNNDESGIYGDVILVNGRPWPLMQVEPRKYRFRILNASVARSFRLSLDTGEPLTVIGTDGGLMPQRVEVGDMRLGMAERYEVVIDFSKYRPGTRVRLLNASPDNNIDYETTNVVMAFEVGSSVSDSSNNDVPLDLNPNMEIMGLRESDAVRSRNIRFKRSNSHWTVNGETWEDVVNSGYERVVANPGLNDVEIWELENSSGGWFHPVHIHLVDFRILDRNGQPPEPYERGPKDVAYVGENETVRVIMRFAHHEGRYMIHCHNLVHEDHDMMHQFQVGGRRAGELDPNDPIEADRCKDLPHHPLFTRPRPRDEDRGGDNSGPGNAAAAAPAPTAPAARPQIKSQSLSRPKAPKCAPAKKAKTKPTKRKATTKKKPVATKRTSTARKPMAKKKPAAVCKPAARKKAAPKKRKSVRSRLGIKKRS
jgi:spore coat protein A